MTRNPALVEGRRLSALLLLLLSTGACIRGASECSVDTECPGSRCVDRGCAAVRCGDGVRGDPERCDLGPENGIEGSGCSASCSLVSCGNGVVEPELGEACEPAIGDPTCREDCRRGDCGDGRLDPGEACDPPTADGACVPGCALPVCGDAFRSPTVGERCDDGNETDDDGCATNCQCARIVQFCGGDDFHAFLDGAGGVWVTGRDPLTLEERSSDLRPLLQPAPRPVERISCGRQSLALFDAEGLRFADSGALAPTGRDASLRLSLPDGSRIVEVAAGSTHVLVLDEAGRLWSWGRDDASTRAALGRDGPAALPAPVEADGATFRSIAAFDDGSLAVRADGQVVSFGSNRSGALGVGRTQLELPERTRPGPVDGLACCTQVHAAARHGFALCSRRPEGGPGEGVCEAGGAQYVWGFGDDDYGALGNGAVPPGLLESCGEACSEPAGVSYGLALCGESASGSAGCALRPLPVPELARSADAQIVLSAGPRHTLAVAPATGELFVFGMTRVNCACPNPGSQYCASPLGLGATGCMARDAPERHPMQESDGRRRVVAASASLYTSIVQLEDGRLLVAGLDGHGKLGLDAPAGERERCRAGCLDRCGPGSCAGQCHVLCDDEVACTEGCKADCGETPDRFGDACVQLCHDECDACEGGPVARLDLTELSFCAGAREAPPTIPGTCSP